MWKTRITLGLLGMVVLLGGMTTTALAADQAAEGTVTGLPALLIIVVVLALLVIGIVAVVRFIARKSKGH